MSLADGEHIFSPLYTQPDTLCPRLPPGSQSATPRSFPGPHTAVFPHLALAAPSGMGEMQCGGASKSSSIPVPIGLIRSLGLLFRSSTNLSCLRGPGNTSFRALITTLPCSQHTRREAPSDRKPHCSLFFSPFHGHTRVTFPRPYDERYHSEPRLVAHAVY